MKKLFNVYFLFWGKLLIVLNTIILQTCFYPDPIERETLADGTEVFYDSFGTDDEIIGLDGCGASLEIAQFIYQNDTT